MKKLLKTNNKGFSLIELIIVIAIMAALIAILAPQYLKYVETSRVAADAATAQDFQTAANVALASGQYTIAAGNNIVFTSTGTTITGADLASAISEYTGATFTTGNENTNFKTTSKNVGNPITYTITVTSTGTSPNITLNTTLSKTNRT